MVGPVGDEIVDQIVEHRRTHATPAAVQPPVDVAEHPFADQLAQTGFGERTEMGIGNVGEAEHDPEELPSAAAAVQSAKDESP